MTTTETEVEPLVTPSNVKPRLLVTPPATVAYPFGLASVATSVPDGDPHWRNGVSWQSPACAEPLVTYDQCLDPAAPAKTNNLLCPATSSADAFTVYVLGQLAPVGVDLEAWLRQALDLGEWRAAEQYLSGKWLAGATNAPGMQAGQTVPVAVGLVEQALADSYSGTGAILTSRLGVTLMAAHHLLVSSGGRLTTHLGTPVAGLAQTSAPDGAAITFLGTGAISYRRSDVEVVADAPSSLNRSVNTLVGFAERTFVVGYDCVAWKATAATTAP